MAERFQNKDNNTDNQNTMNIPIPHNRPNYQSGNQKNLRPLRQRNNQNNSYQNYTQYPNRQYRNPDYPNQSYPNSNYNPQQYHQQPYYQSPEYRNQQYNNSNFNRNYSSPPRQNPPRKKKRKHKSIFGRFIKRIICSLLTLFILLFGIYSCTSFSIIGKIGKQDSTGRNRTIGALSKSYVKSILVIGTDGRSSEEQGRSDSMILVSFNSRTNEIILTSFMRDCYVNIPNYGMDKLNASYSYGGADLLMDTIESNFMIEIDDYVTINFISFAGIIDSVGGIDIEVTDDEAQEINNILFSEVNGLMGDDQWSDFLDGGGTLHLNGKQALSYARIRYVGNSDFERTSRQREVITKIIPKVINPVAISKIAKNVIPEVNTNMSSIEMYLFSLRVPFSVTYDIKQIQVPADGTFYAEDVWTSYGEIQNVLQVDFGANYNVLETEIFSH